MPQFLINSKDIDSNMIIIDDKENYNHIAKSLRVRIGENLLLIDENEIQYETKVEEITKNYVKVSIENSYKSKRKLDYDLYIAISPLNSNAINTIFEKLTELGVRGFYPIYTDNCAVKKDVITKKIERWQKICYESFKQCERADIPTCFELTTIQEVIKKEFDHILCFTERSSKYQFKEFLNNNKFKQNDKILVIIGPEGGFSKKEFEFFEKENLNTISLGELILRADTASIVAIGNIIYENSNIGKT